MRLIYSFIPAVWKGGIARKRCFYYSYFFDFLRQKKGWQPTAHISFSFPKTHSAAVFLRAEREGNRQRQGKKKKERGRGVVWPTFQASLCTVGRAMHAEQLESLCNYPPPPCTHILPHALSWFFKKWNIQLLSCHYHSSLQHSCKRIWGLQAPLLPLLFSSFSENTWFSSSGKSQADRLVCICSLG